MIEILFLLIVFCAAGGYGSSLLRVTSLNFSSPFEKCAFSLGLGWGVLGYLVFFTGLLGWLYPAVIYSLVAIGFLLSLIPILGFIKSKNNIPVISGYLFYFAALVLAVVLIASFLKTFSPPIGNDPLVYHLDLPKRFLNHHQIIYFPYTANSTFPLLVEMLYVIGLSMKGALLAQMIHWGMGLTAGIAIYALARNFLKWEFAFLASVIFLSIPGIFHQMPTANNDVGLALFLILQVYAVWKYVESQNLVWIAIAGLFAGFALSVKLIAVIGIIPAVVALLLFSGKKNFKNALIGVLLFGVICLAASFVWYLRAYLLTGNPVFPFFSKFFGVTAGHDYALGKHGVGKGLLDFILAPWNMIVHSEPFGGRGNQLGPLFLLILPALVFLKKFNNKFLSFILVYCGIYFVLWFWGPQNLRFFFPAAALLSIFLAALFQYSFESFRSIFRIFIAAILFFCLAFNALIAVYYLKNDYKVILGMESRDAYLTRSERSYAIAKFVNQNVPQNANILSREVRSFYFQPDISRYSYFAQKEDVKGNFLATLKKGEITYVLLLDVKSEKGPYPLNPLVESHSAQFEKVGENLYSKPGETAHYTLLKLKH